MQDYSLHGCNFKNSREDLKKFRYEHNKQADVDFDEIEKEFKNTKDGRIRHTSQGQIGDCWLLSGVNALSYNEIGREILKNTLEYQDDSTIVHFKGAGDYEITNKELENALNYSTGDDDMVILELAIEKAYEDICDNKVIYEDSAPIPSKNSLLDDLKEADTTLHGGETKEAIYLISGKTSNTTKNKDDFEKYLNEFQNNKDLILNASICNDSKDTVIELKDISGNTIQFGNPHAYAVIKSNNKYIMLSNPWNSGNRIILDRKTFIDNFDKMSVCDLSSNNPENNLSHELKEDENGNKFTIYDYKGEEYWPLGEDETLRYSKKKVVYSTNDENELVFKKEILYDENNNEVCKHEKDESGNMTTTHSQYECGSKFAIKEVNTSKNRTYYVCEYNSQGELVNEAEFYTYYLVEQMYAKNLFENQDITFDEILDFLQVPKSRVSGIRRNLDK